MQMGPVELTSFEELYDVQNHMLKTTAKFRLTDSLKVDIKASMINFLCHTVAAVVMLPAFSTCFGSL